MDMEADDDHDSVLVGVAVSDRDDVADAVRELESDCDDGVPDSDDVALSEGVSVTDDVADGERERDKVTVAE